MQTFHATPADAFAQPDTAAALDTRIQNLNARSENVLSTLLDVGDLRFVAANADNVDALSFMLLKPVVAGTQVGFTDRNFVGLPAVQRVAPPADARPDLSAFTDDSGILVVRVDPVTFKPVPWSDGFVERLAPWRADLRV
jgi:hypothetical protein